MRIGSQTRFSIDRADEFENCNRCVDCVELRIGRREREGVLENEVSGRMMAGVGFFIERL